MAIEILHRYTKAVLYRSEKAADLRAAVTEAVSARADLAGAYLARADLAGADLAGAYLARAYLARADLAGANLAGAYLAGAYLAGAYLAGADLAGAYLAGAYLARAYLAGAYLARADLARADLAGADLAGANLAGAYLAGAYLAGANLARANGLNKILTTPLYLLQHQAGPIRAFKLVNATGEGIYNGGLTYCVGKSVSVPNASTDELEQCAAGINVADLTWIAREFRAGHRVLVVEFTAPDIAAIPVASNGKFRLHRCKVVEEIEPHTLGLPIGAPEAAEAVSRFCQAVA